MKLNLPDLNDIRKAHERIKPHVHHTSVLTCSAIDAACGGRLFFKCENFQKVGAFKVRGAANAVFSLSEKEAKQGVVTHSSGNHGAALALAARRRGIKAYVVMPDNSNAVKVAAVRSYGAEISFCTVDLSSREEVCADVIKRTGAYFVHPYDDPFIIAGQGTAAKELCEDVADLDCVIVPVGGGGLLSGTAVYVGSALPGTRIYGVEPEMADDACRSFHAGKIIPSVSPQTIADGLLTSLGELTFALIKKHVTDIITVSEADIVWAMRIIWERMKIIVEPSAAVPLAALLRHKLDISGKQVGIILSGGNVDLDSLPWIESSIYPSVLGRSA
jgi:threonine dehydratase